MDNNDYALVTGASTGIGRAIAEELAKRKYNLVLQSLPGEDLAGVSENLMKSYNIKVEFLESDLTADDAPKSLFEFVTAKDIRITVLVNNAGIGYEGPVESYSENQVDRMILLNTRALTLLTIYFTPALKKAGKAYVLNVSSFGSYMPTAYKSIYLATKSYIYYFTRAIDSEFRGTGVKTCVLLPSAVHTNKFTKDRIVRGGFFSRKSALTAEETASAGVKALFRGRKACIPGKLTGLLFAIGVILPEGILMMMTRRIFRNYKNEKEQVN
jgi:uncharacterized protein